MHDKKAAVWQPFLGGYMQLDERLTAVADFVPRNSSAADIGTDHAYLAVVLAERGAAKVIAADLNAGPCESARRTVRDNGYAGKIEVRQGNGLAVLKPGEVKIVCIAGMGGELIKEILAARPEITKDLERLVLQPMNEAESLREWLYNHNWKIIDETLVRESGRMYEIICAEPGDAACPEKSLLEIGEKLWEKRHPLLKEHIDRLLQKKEKVLTGMRKSEIARESSRYKVILKEKEELEAKSKCLNVKL